MASDNQTSEDSKQGDESKEVEPSQSSMRPSLSPPGGHNRRQSLTAAEILRSSGLSAATIEPLSPTDSLPDIYRKQASTINTLTEEKARLKEEIERLKKLEDELEEFKSNQTDSQRSLEEAKNKLREAETEVANTKESVEKLNLEIETLVCYLSIYNDWEKKKKTFVLIYSFIYRRR